MEEIEEQESDQNSLTPPSEEGYAITIQITPNGFTITKDGSEPVDVKDSTSMLKAVLSIVQSNPSVDDANEQMEAGYNS